MAITIDVNVGDVIMGGRFKNKPIKVKSIGKDEHGMPTINGRKVVNFRIRKPVDEKMVRDKDGFVKYKNGHQAYMIIRPEQEAYDNDQNADYLATRPRYSWIKKYKV